MEWKEKAERNSGYCLFRPAARDRGCNLPGTEPNIISKIQIEYCKAIC